MAKCSAAATSTTSCLGAQRMSSCRGKGLGRELLRTRKEAPLYPCKGWTCSCPVRALLLVPRATCWFQALGGVMALSDVLPLASFRLWTVSRPCQTCCHLLVSGYGRREGPVRRAARRPSQAAGEAGAIAPSTQSLPVCSLCLTPCKACAAAGPGQGHLAPWRHVPTRLCSSPNPCAATS